MGGGLGGSRAGKAVKAVSSEDAGESGHRDSGQHGADLGIGAPCAAQVEDVGLEFGGGGAGLAPRS